MIKHYRNQRDLRRTRVRGKIRGTADMPRISVFRSNKSLFVQLIDDTVGKTLVALGGCHVKSEKKITKTEMSFLVGKKLAEEALKKKIKQAVFDRGGYQYKGRVAAIAQGAREGGLKI